MKMENSFEKNIEKCNFSTENIATNGDTVNPVLKGLARLNGQVNRMTIAQLINTLKSHDLDTRGKPDVLKKRLKAYYKKKELSTANIKDPNEINYFYKYLIIIDYEATCDVGQTANFKQEIIEFPAILLKTKDKIIVDEFHSYVKPVVNPKLTTFCTTLTGITQELVNSSPKFPEVLSMFEKWLQRHNLNNPLNNYVVLTDGPWDMGRFLVEQCRISNIEIPEWGKHWINIRKTYSNFYDTKRICLKDMLLRLGMRFEGKPHSGIDDARNIARVAQMLMRDGANLRENEGLKERSGSLIVANISRKEFEEIHSKGSKRTYKTKSSRSKSEKSIIKENENGLDNCINDYLLNIDPPLSNSDFPLLMSTTNRFSALNINA